MGIQHVSSAGLNLIKKFEGCRLSAYRCPAGVWTIGYGHTAGVYAGMTITQSQAEDLLKTDLERYEKPVRNYDNKYHWNQNQFDALVSFTYNCGAGNLNKLLANGSRNTQQIADNLPNYNKGGGKVLAGLVRRRNEERTLFLSPVQQASVKENHNNSSKINNETESAQSKDATLSGVYYVTASALRLRKGAGTNKEIIVDMPRNSKVRCYGHYTSVSGVKWLYVIYDGKVGFASIKYLRKG